MSLSEEQIKKLHVVLVLTGDHAGFDNSLTGMREWWRDGHMEKTAPGEDLNDWLHEPNPWTNSPNINPYVFE